MYSIQKPSKQKSTYKKKLGPIWVAVIVLGLSILVVAALELTNTTYFFHARKPVSGPIPSTNPGQKQQPSGGNTGGSSSSSATTSSPGSPADTPGSAKVSTPPPATNTPLIVPHGTFVSNHRPNLSGSPAPSQEASTCNTTPGATCYIQFSKDGITKTLTAQTVDGSGATYWSWDVKTSGLTAGTWQITAVATLNGQTKAAPDTMSLQVAP